jgi:hypothetical protein
MLHVGLHSRPACKVYGTQQQTPLGSVSFYASAFLHSRLRQSLVIPHAAASCTPPSTRVTQVPLYDVFVRLRRRRPPRGVLNRGHAARTPQPSFEENKGLLCPCLRACATLLHKRQRGWPGWLRCTRQPTSFRPRCFPTHTRGPRMRWGALSSSVASPITSSDIERDDDFEELLGEVDRAEASSASAASAIASGAGRRSPATSPSSSTAAAARSPGGPSATGNASLRRLRGTACPGTCPR